MVSNTYGTFNPAGIEPYPIETSLAQAAATSPAEAQLMLNSYTAQRQATAGQYANELDQQHAQARAQIAAQMADARMKAFTGTAHDPASLAIAASSPELSSMIGLDTANPDVLRSVMGQQTRLQNADIAQKGGAAGASLTTAGAQPSSEQFGELTGLTGLKVGDPVAIQAAKIAAAARIAAANASRPPTGPSTSVQEPLGPNGEVVAHNFGPKSGVGQSAAEINAWREAHGYVQPRVNVPPPGDGATAPTPPPASGNATNLPMAKTEGAGGTGPGTTVRNTTKGAPDLQRLASTYVEGQLRTSDPKAYDNVKAAAALNGGKIVLEMNPDGTLRGIKGKDGRVY